MSLHVKRKYTRAKRITLDRNIFKCHETRMIFELSCEFCTNSFWSVRRTTRFCSNNCRQLNYLDKKQKK